VLKFKPALLSVGIAFALSFTLSCSQDDGGSDGNSSSSVVNGGGISSSSGGPGPDGSLNGIWQKIGRNYTFEINGSNAVWKENSSNPDENDIIEGTITYGGSSGSWKINRGTIPFQYEVSSEILTISGASADFMVDWVAGLNGQYQKSGGIGNPSSSSVGSSSSSAGGGQSSSSVGSHGGVVGAPVTHGGETYQTVVIGNQTWFARNLNYNAPGSKCYGEGGEVYDYETDEWTTLSSSEIQANCQKYGRLYNWATAMDICPTGWHLPSNDDWDELFRYVDEQNDGDGDGTPYDSYTAGGYLKATSGWNSSGNGTDQYGFSALPGGYGYSDGNFLDAGINGYWWSASEDDSNYAYYRNMYYDDEGAYWGYYNKSYLFSVRCLQD
jgi:uncharacterized protein (TIGR02145 family)